MSGIGMKVDSAQFYCNQCGSKAGQFARHKHWCPEVQGKDSVSITEASRLVAELMQLQAKIDRIENFVGDKPCECRFSYDEHCG